MKVQLPGMVEVVYTDDDGTRQTATPNEGHWFDLPERVALSLTPPEEAAPDEDGSGGVSVDTGATGEPQEPTDTTPAPSAPPESPETPPEGSVDAPDEEE